MKVAYLDCFSGISGDMFLGALTDAGLDFKAWLSEVSKLKLSGYSVTKKKVKRAGIAGTKITVKVTAPQPHRNLPAIERLIRKSGISPWAKETALKIFIRLAEAEAAAHGVKVDEVHFHEVGAVDSIVDIAGAAIAVEIMGIEKIFSSPLNLGSGVVKFSHGTFPVPAPATAELIKGIPAYSSGTMAELTTPTGAAIAATLAEGFGPMPAMKTTAAGYGAGGRDIPDTPNMLRVFIGEAGGAVVGDERDEVDLVETNIDDMDPRICGHVMERLLEAGALDVWLTPVIMKKSRPAYTLSILADSDKSPALVDIVMSETTTFGVRISRVQRQKLARRIIEVKTRSGTCRVKVGSYGGRRLKAVPEYEDARALAKKSGRPLIEVIKEIEKLAGFIDIS